VAKVVWSYLLLNLKENESSNDESIESAKEND
jgi:hypothetical protein